MTTIGKTLVLCDFDGTASPVDVGNRLLNRFTAHGWEDIDRDYCAGRIGSLEAYKRIALLFRGARHEMIEYVLAVASLDQDFETFYRLCRGNDIDVKIVSDGLDFYIEALLDKHDLTGLEYYANRAIFDGEALFFEFPGASEDCGRCGNCKKSILHKYRQDYEHIVYIGDSYSDICPAKYADLVFAKTILYDKYSGSGRNVVYFENFCEVIRNLQDRGLLLT